MKKIKNILFIMCDQLRADYLGCNGHPHIETKNIDWLASKSVNFSRAYVQALSVVLLECRSTPVAMYRPTEQLGTRVQSE